jgi:hypothetical protein
MSRVTPEEIGTEFILGLRHAQSRVSRDGHVEEWEILGRAVARRTAAQAWISVGLAPDFGSPVQVYNEMSWSLGVTRDTFMDAVTPLVSGPDARGRMFLVPTMDELRTAFASTDTNTVDALVNALHLTEVDSLLAERLWARTNRSRPHEHLARHASESEYVALRAAARQADIGYVMALLDAGLPAPAVTQLCVLPPMPVEYAIAMVDGGAA